MLGKYLVALNAHEKIGCQTLRKALKAFGNNPEKLWNATTPELKGKLAEKICSLVLEAKKQFEPDLLIRKLQSLDRLLHNF